MITIDLDGTLLDSGSKISEEDRKAVQYCMTRGIKVTLSTGKSMRYAGKIIKDLGLKDLQIVSGGTMVVEPTLRQIYTIKISRQSTEEAIKLARAYEVGFALETTDGILYYDRYYPGIELFYSTGEVIEKVDNVMTEYNLDNTLLFTFTINENHCFNRVLESMIMPDIKIIRGGPCYLNVLNRYAGKLAGLKKITSLYGIHSEEVMAIGDNDNDLETLKFAGISVAMGNSPDNLKEMADYVTDDNDNNGVAKAIYRFMDN